MFHGITAPVTGDFTHKFKKLKLLDQLEGKVVIGHGFRKAF